MVSVFLSYKSKSSHSNFVLLVPDFIISVYCNSYNYLFLSHSLFFSTSISWPPSCNALGMPLHRNIEREQRSENEAEKDIITWTAVHRYCKIRDYLVKAYIIHIFHFIKFVSARLDDEGKIWTWESSNFENLFSGVTFNLKNQSFCISFKLLGTNGIFNFKCRLRGKFTSRRLHT